MGDGYEGDLRRALEARVAALEERDRRLELEVARLAAQVAQHARASRDADGRSRVQQAESERSELSGEVERLKQLLKDREAELRQARGDAKRKAQRLEALETSASYRVMRRLWRINAAVRKPLRRHRPADSPEVDTKPPFKTVPRAAAETPRRGQATSPPARSVTVDVEHERSLARAPSFVPDPRDLRVAAVLDDMSAACFAPECHLIQVGAENWEQLMEEREPHLLLVESAWAGNGGSWQYQVASYPHPHYAGLPRLRRLLDWCDRKAIPTVFWNKEDPVHLDRFAEAAALFDHIFTTDANCVARYWSLPGVQAQSVEALPFAAQPRIHNPVGAAVERSDAPCFAGTYYRDRHEARQGTLGMLLDAARPFGLVIYDRRFGSEDDSFGFPERFRAHIAGRLPYERMVEAYKRHRLFLNVNSVTDSPTMLSRRVFELLACETAVISTESLAVRELFASLVPIVCSVDEATAAIERLLGDDAYRGELTAAGRRLVLTEHTYEERLLTVARTAGYPVSSAARTGVCALVVVDGNKELAALPRLMDVLARQTSTPLEVLIGVPSDTSLNGELQALDERRDLRVRVVSQAATATEPERVRELAALTTAPWIAPMRAGISYGKDFLTDLLVSTRFADADVIGLAAPDGNDGPGERYVDAVHPHAALARSELVRQRAWPSSPEFAAELLPRWFREGVRYYLTGNRNSARELPGVARSSAPHRAAVLERRS